DCDVDTPAADLRAQLSVKNMDPFLRASAVVDFDSPVVANLVEELNNTGSGSDYVERCFVWVRDNIAHSADVDSDVVACSASEVLRAGVGLCYAKSHLLAALLRAKGIRAGFAYQRLASGRNGYCLH